MLPNFRAIGGWPIRSAFRKSVRLHLLEQDVPYLLPMVRKLTVWKGRRRQSFSPLFPSYVFFCGGEETRYRALSTHRICQVIPVRDRQQFVNELAAVERGPGIGHAAAILSICGGWKALPDARGPLKGIEGIVAQASGITHLVLQISMLGQAHRWKQASICSSRLSDFGGKKELAMVTAD